MVEIKDVVDVMPVHDLLVDGTMRVEVTGAWTSCTFPICSWLALCALSAAVVVNDGGALVSALFLRSVVANSAPWSLMALYE